VIVLKYANLALAFFLELFALAALGYWGFTNGEGLPAKIGLDVGVPLLATVLWGVFESPRVSLPLRSRGTCCSRWCSSGVPPRRSTPPITHASRRCSRSS
jgi:Protein of unknown function (DUF2568)